MKNVSGKVVLVTGASMGIGEAIARAFSAEGAKLAVVARSLDKLEALARSLPGEALPLRADMSRPEEARAMVQKAAVEPTARSGNAGETELQFSGEGGAPPQSRLSGARGTRALFEANVSVGGQGYDLVIEGTGGPNPKADYRWAYIPWDTTDKFLYSMAAFPYELQEMVDKLLWKTLTSARKIHATDPEGTDMTWSWDPKFEGMLRENWPGYEILKQGHISPMPLFMSPVEANANGKIAGNINHQGTFPHLVLTIQKNDIVKVEGGGEFGRRWDEVLQDCKNVGIHYPGFPAPGCGWFEEAAIGTDPWRTRDLAADIRNRYVWERGRSGVIHWGL
ncbi:MAG TPA: SDR family NAD(P)-dependent oxidoreductase, partial [Terriglobia bacterium]